jgi:diguanylate cyclase (GGDEF)-like protein
MPRAQRRESVFSDGGAPVFSGGGYRELQDSDPTPEQTAGPAPAWADRALALLRSWCGGEGETAKRLRTIPHVAWAVGSAGFLSAGLFLLMKRANLLPWSARRSSQPVPAHCTYDSVTGLPTTRLFMRLANQALARARRAGRQVAIVLVEFDRFASEDRPGVDQHNLASRIQAARLKSALHTSDMVARLGERSFAALIDPIDDVSAVGTVAAKIQAAVSLPVLLEGREMVLSSRVGIALSGPGTTDPVSLLNVAQRAISEAAPDGSVICDLPDGVRIPAHDPSTGSPLP